MNKFFHQQQKKLDQFVALGSGGQYANYQEQAQTAPDTSGVSSAGAITGGMDSQRGLTSSNLGQHQEAARVQPSTSMVAYLLKHFQVTMGASMLKMKLERGHRVFFPLVIETSSLY